ncbi:XPA binding protein 1, putative [Plasmodium ovale wallikeri]|uniref:GPN-loop GTPase 1 n=1 Tax=Plasmodium ovale wallikeri TaxID=864142 RepID=A0A1A8ZJA0_PLAOA|nr:XPA binding protein 1, putative [Plasmodium ovale wallikeri]SBT44481.1 XPA binding protein 1, putative [Plasmodium ovale wallikeri]
MEEKKENVKEKNKEKEANNIDNYKISSAVECAGIFKNEQSDRKPSKNFSTKKNSDPFERNDDKTEKRKNNSEKREYPILDAFESINEDITVENVGKEEGKKVHSQHKNERESNDFEEKKENFNYLNKNGTIITTLKESDTANLAKNATSNFLESGDVANGTQRSENMNDYYKKLPTVIIAIGMAGSGKTTYIGALYNYLKVEKKKKVYTINLDPAVKHLHYSANIDIRDSIKYHEVMKEYKLGPNGAIMTCLNLFATRFDKVIEMLEKRKYKLNYIIVDTPGQIEVFNWSASGNIILETLSVSFPVVINYIIDTVRCERPITFMSNMLYACSVLYKTRLPFLACFNKIDVIRHDKCIEWMKNYDSFNEDVLRDESYMASFSRSCALMINEFYEEIKTVGISSKTNEGFNHVFKKLELLKEEYIEEYVSLIEKQMKRIKKRKEKDIKLKMESFLIEKQKNVSISKNNITK